MSNTAIYIIRESWLFYKSRRDAPTGLERGNQSIRRKTKAFALSKSMKLESKPRFVILVAVRNGFPASFALWDDALLKE